MNTRLIISLIFFISMLSCNDTVPLYRDANENPDKRARDLLERMTEDEKFWQMFMIPGDLSNSTEDYYNGIFGLQVAAKGKNDSASGQMIDYDQGSPAGEAAEKINSIQKYFIDSTRLGIPVIPFDEALHGLVRSGATSFPQSIGLAATFDVDLMADVAACIAEETRSRGIRQILSPVINIARDVRWGRTEETYGEDPFLCSEMAVSFVREFESRGIITTPKHFVTNVGDGGRDSYPIHFNERLLEEIYFPAYKACFEKGGSRSVMTAYNSLNGSPCTANKWLLRDKLKGEWNFRGFVISDAGATGGANVLHFTASDYPSSTANAINAGLDVIFQTSYSHYPLFKPAFDNGTIKKEFIDDAVYRILKAKFELGLFDDPYADPDEASRINGSKEHLDKSLEAARKSIVLLKNDKNTLPVSEHIKNIALIGTDATEARLGGYSGPGVLKTSIFTGITERSGSRHKIEYEPGCGRYDNRFRLVDNKLLTHKDKMTTVAGLHGEYFDNPYLEGDPVIVRHDGQINFGWTLYSPHPDLPYDWYSVRWTGILTAPVTDKVKIGIEGNDGYRLYINDKLIIDNWVKKSYGCHTEEYEFIKGDKYNLRVEFYETAGNARIKLIWDYGVQDDAEQRINAAVNLALRSDMAVIVAGIEEGEFRDRALLGLPGRQEEMINRISETGIPVVVVLIGGSAIKMNGWMDNAESIIDAWYPGDMGGYAVADVLFGLYNPAGRLPITFPLDESQLPLFYNHKPTGRGDDYMNLTGQALFPFGYGLSYTSFEYSDLKIEQDTIPRGGGTKLTCTITNTGSRKGDEVVQMYIRDEISSLARPIIELKGFERISLNPGEQKNVEFNLGFEELAMFNHEMNQVVEPGRFRIMIGSSSKDIRLRAHLYVE